MILAFFAKLAQLGLLLDFLLSLLVQLLVVFGELSEDFATDALQLEGLHLLEGIGTVLALKDGIHITDHFLFENCGVGGKHL